MVPLRQIASFDYTQEYPIVWRRNRVPTLTVQADVVPGVLPATAVNTVQPRIDKLAATLPSGYRIVTGGSVEESAKAKASVLVVVPAMMRWDGEGGMGGGGGGGGGYTVPVRSC